MCCVSVKSEAEWPVVSFGGHWSSEVMVEDGFYDYDCSCSKSRGLLKWRHKLHRAGTKTKMIRSPVSLCCNSAAQECLSNSSLLDAYPLPLGILAYVVDLQREKTK